MHPPLVAVLLLATQAPFDSTEVARVLAQLQASDSTVCDLAGQALTNDGGFWKWGAGAGLGVANAAMPMPRPMPTPMPMPGSGGMGHVMRDVMRAAHGAHRSGVEAATLGAFRAVVRDDNRCVRNIAARVLGRHGPDGTYELFVALLRDTRPGLRATGALGLGELEDARAIGPLGDALDDADVAVRVTAARALGEIEDAVAIDPLARALRDRAPEVRRTAAWALGEIEDASAVPLVAALKDREIEVRVAAAWALGEIESPRALDALEAAQQDASAAVRVRVRPRVKIRS